MAMHISGPVTVSILAATTGKLREIWLENLVVKDTFLRCSTTPFWSSREKLSKVFPTKISSTKKGGQTLLIRFSFPSLHIFERRLLLEIFALRSPARTKDRIGLALHPKTNRFHRLFLANSSQVWHQ